MKRFIIGLSSIFLLFFIFFRHKQTTLEINNISLSNIAYTYRLGFINLTNELNNKELIVKGEIPSWLSGTLLRNGPALFNYHNSWVSNWFDGLAMLHAFQLNKGKVIYSNKFIKSDDYKNVINSGSMSYQGFVQDSRISLFKRLTNVITHFNKPFMPNANVNIVQHDQTFIALTEVPLPVRFDPETLETLGAFNYGDLLPRKNIHQTAHPHFDIKSKELLAYFTEFGLTSTYNVFSMQQLSNLRQLIVSIPTKRPSYMHTFSITPRYAILIALPLIADQLSLLFTAQGFIKNFNWKPQVETEFIVIDRIEKKVVGTYNVDPFFAFHTVNAFEQDSMINVDIVTYPDPSVIGRSYLDKLLSSSTTKPSQLEMRFSNSQLTDAALYNAGLLTRYSINLQSGVVTHKALAEPLIELPRINYERYNGQDYTYVYAFGPQNGLLGTSYAYVGEKLVKINVKTSQVVSWQEKNTYPGEPVFIASDRAKEEDEGVVLSVVLDAKVQKSFLLVLDARNFKELARAYVPHHIPFGIHGMFSAANI